VYVFDVSIQQFTKQMLGCFNPNLGKIWTNPNVGLKNSLIHLQLKVEVGLK